MDASRSGTLGSSILILISSVFGSSILAVPFAFSKCGWFLGTICLIFCGLLTQLGAHFLLESAYLVSSSLAPSSSPRCLAFSDIAARATPRLAFLPNVLVVVNCLGSAVASLVVAGDLMPRTFRDLAILSDHSSLIENANGLLDDYLLHRSLWVSLILLLVLPLCFLRSITPLRYAGLVTCIAVSYFIIVVVTLFIFPSAGACLLYSSPPSSSISCAKNVIPFPPSLPVLLHHLLLACPVFFFSFSINFQVLPIHNALRNPSLHTTHLAIATALICSGLTYLLVSLSAYSTFGELVQSNLFKNYGNTWPLDTARLLMLLVVALLYPLVIFSARASLLTLLRPSSSSSSPPSRRLFILLTCLLLLLSFGLALAFQDLSVILGTVGALATVPISLTLPSLYYLSLALPPSLPSQQAKEGDGEGGRGGEGWRIVARLGVGMGLLMSIVFLYGTYV